MIDKKITFKFFNYKWARVPKWAKATDKIYREWYLERYGYEDFEGLKEFLANKSLILDAGCGLGRDAKMFAEANPKAKIVAVDQSENAIKVAKESLKEYNCKVVKDDIITFKWKDKFDFISCDQVVHHTPRPSKTIKNLFEQLNPGGILNFSVCRLKNRYRNRADDLIMQHAAKLSPEQLWKFAEAVTEFARALYNLEIDDVWFENNRYDNLQRFVHDNLFRTWYNPDIDFELSVSSNYDWFSGNPRFALKHIKSRLLKDISNYEILRRHQDNATISVSLKKQ